MIISEATLSDKRYTPQKLYNKLIKAEEYVAELQLITDKIMIKVDSENDLKSVHAELYDAYYRVMCILKYLHNAMRSKK